MYPVQMLDGETKYLCTDCTTNPKNKITFCDICYEAFEYADEGWVPAHCDKCKGKSIKKKGAVL